MRAIGLKRAIEIVSAFLILLADGTDPAIAQAVAGLASRN